MRQLLWKEWHEQSWKLAFGCIVLATIAVIGLHSRMVSDQTLLEWICLLGTTILPVLASTGLIPPERSEGSFESLLAMPITPWRILLCKTVMGIILCLGPLLTATVLSTLLAGGREMLIGSMINFYLRSMLASIILFLWMFALTIRSTSEARAAMVAVGVVIIWMMINLGIAMHDTQGRFYLVSPYGVVEGSDSAHPTLYLTVLIQPLLLIVVWFAALRAMTFSAEKQS